MTTLTRIKSTTGPNCVAPSNSVKTAHIRIWLAFLTLILAGCANKTPGPINSKADQLLWDAACSSGEVGVKDALNSGANPNCRDSEGVTPLSCASRNGNANIIKLLCEAGADVNLANQDGVTPLSRMIFGLFNYTIYDDEQRGGLISLLLKYKANPKLKNNNGQSSIDIVNGKLSELEKELADNDRALDEAGKELNKYQKGTDQADASTSWYDLPLEVRVAQNKITDFQVEKSNLQKQKSSIQKMKVLLEQN